MRAAILTLAALAGGACTPEPVDAACFSRASSEIGGPISLTSHTGARVTEDNFKGRKTFVFFGFTHCPDFCPATLYALGSAMSMLPDNVERPRTAFISVDPERDTPEELARYIKSNGFPADIVGLTGTLDELESVAKAFASDFSRAEDADSAAGYQVNHTTILFLMDENWKLETFFRPEERPETIANCIRALS
jgi:protein SCO1/2